MCLTGLQDVQVFHEEKMEAVVGQDVVLPCIVKKSTDLQIVGIEWRKNRNENTKLALYSSVFGLNLFWPNVTFQLENSSIGSNLHLSGVTKWDSGIYICDLTTFPLGSIRRETELKIKGKTRANTCKAVPAHLRQALQSSQGLNIWMMCSNFLSNCPLHIFHVTPDCIRALLLCQSQQLFTSEQMYLQSCCWTPVQEWDHLKHDMNQNVTPWRPVFEAIFLALSLMVLQWWFWCTDQMKLKTYYQPATTTTTQIANDNDKDPIWNPQSYSNVFVTARGFFLRLFEHRAGLTRVLVTSSSIIF